VNNGGGWTKRRKYFALSKIFKIMVFDCLENGQSLFLMFIKFVTLAIFLFCCD